MTAAWFSAALAFLLPIFPLFVLHYGICVEEVERPKRELKQSWLSAISFLGIPLAHTQVPTTELAVIIFWALGFEISSI
ncbi:hypothetical protein B0J18DRAFT_436801 [Chaetomium sp. MPI-SDFR-AT-0129]|nr:hypothetical protein B0J18DRAFT_436801 [Chaetomium sp. MPI-SDFR-AT-0129]